MIIFKQICKIWKSRNDCVSLHWPSGPKWNLKAPLKAAAVTSFRLQDCIVIGFFFSSFFLELFLFLVQSLAGFLLSLNPTLEDLFRKEGKAPDLEDNIQA